MNVNNNSRLQFILQSNSTSENTVQPIQNNPIIQCENEYVSIEANIEEKYDEENRNSALEVISQQIVNLNKLVILNLQNCNLVRLPMHFNLLNNIRQLNLSNNALQEIPVCIHNGMNQLTHLDVSKNHIKIFDHEPACIKLLKSLNLSHNKFLNPPHWFLLGKCDNLEEFYYNGNNTSTLKAIKSLSAIGYKLKKLEYVSSYLVSEDLTYFKSFHCLQSLNISNAENRKANVINIDILRENNKWLRTINILQCNFLDISLLSEKICEFKYLQELYLSNNRLSWLPDSIVKLSQLRILDVEHNNLSYLPENFYKLNKLEMLRCAFNCLSNASLADLTNLKYIDLYHNDIDLYDIPVASVEFIDLENNYVQVYETGYEKKKEALRSTLKCKFDRSDGCKKEVVSDNYSTRSSISEESSYASFDLQNMNDGADVSEEMWEYNDGVKNSNITISDDEYTGQLELITNVKKSVVCHIDDNLFEDAD